MDSQDRRPTSTVSRISRSLPPELLGELDDMVKNRGYDNRSRAIREMVRYELVEHQRTLGNEIMVGTLNLLYDRAARGVITGHLQLLAAVMPPISTPDQAN